MVNQLGVVPEHRDNLVEFGHPREPAHEVAVAEVAVGRPPQQPGSDDRVTVHEPAQSLHDVNPAPAGHPLRQPDQCIRTAGQALEAPCCEWAEGTGEQSDDLDQWNVVHRAHGSEQGQPDRDGGRIRRVPHQPPTDFPCAAFPSHVGGDDVLDVVDRYVDVMEAVVQRTRHSLRIGEVLVENPGDIDSHQLAVARRFRARSTSAPFLIGIRLAFAWQGLVRRQPMQSERVAEQRCLMSGQSNPGCLAHRRAEDSILLITPRGCHRSAVTTSPLR
ncbi:hypothetical protein [Streptomyces sp. V4I2]|uniref:hypothetical protein n=1 Tax=Streptomyces sp. V4I2 TaxID=3042280 RepID=UPI00277FB4B9|nr:hypothetical protein [Streptomyces sp. V4I2]MDQ1049105.1 hypothetical protein [Streptomyces sp. V4I2]